MLSKQVGFESLSQRSIKGKRNYCQRIGLSHWFLLSSLPFPRPYPPFPSLCDLNLENSDIQMYTGS